MSIDLRLLIKNGVHFGHQTSRWSPKMEPYIWGHKNDIYLIDVSKTAYQIEQASKFLESVIAQGRSILWVGTKKAAQDIIEKTAQQLDLPYVAHRWVGGTFSNYRQVRKSIANLLRYEDILAASEQYPYNKKELNLLKKKHARLNNIVGGIRKLSWPVGAVVVVDVKKEHVCVKEAITMGIPVVALVDTNSDPSNITYVIPANDDAPRSIAVVIDYLAEAVRKGQAEAAARPKDELPMVETFETLTDLGLEPEEDEEASKRRAAAGRRAKKAPVRQTGRRPEVRAPHEEVATANKSTGEAALERVVKSEEKKMQPTEPSATSGGAEKHRSAKAEAGEATQPLAAQPVIEVPTEPKQEE